MLSLEIDDDDDDDDDDTDDDDDILLYPFTLYSNQVSLPFSSAFAVVVGLIGNRRVIYLLSIIGLLYIYIYIYIYIIYMILLLLESVVLFTSSLLNDLVE